MCLYEHNFIYFLSSNQILINFNSVFGQNMKSNLTFQCVNIAGAFLISYAVIFQRLFNF